VTCRSIALAVLVAASSARADGLDWRAPAGCPAAEAVRAAVERRLEASLDSVAFTVDVEIAQGDAGFVATIRVPDTTDRVLTSASCDELTDAAAIVVARLAKEARDRTALRAPPIVAPAAVVPPVVAVVEPPPVVRPPHWTAAIRASAIAGTGNVPDVGGAGELAASLAWDHVFVEVAGARWLTSRAALDEAAMAGVDVQLEAAALRTGWQREVLRAWVGGELGRLQGTGVGLTASRTNSGRWLAAGGGIGAAWRVAGHVRGVVGLDVEIAIRRVQFALDSGSVIYRSSPVAVRAGVGIELFWR
jgi:hypothetical protein